MAVEIISWSISARVWDWDGIDLVTPGSAVRHVTDCAMGPCPFMKWGMPGHTPGDILVLLNGSYHKEYNYIWFWGLGSAWFPRYIAFYEVKGWGGAGPAMPQGTSRSVLLNVSYQLGLGMPRGLPLSPGFQITNFLAKLNINIYHIKNISE